MHLEYLSVLRCRPWNSRCLKCSLECRRECRLECRRECRRECHLECRRLTLSEELKFALAQDRALQVNLQDEHSVRSDMDSSASAVLGCQLRKVNNVSVSTDHPRMDIFRIDSSPDQAQSSEAGSPCRDTLGMGDRRRTCHFAEIEEAKEDLYSARLAHLYLRNPFLCITTKMHIGFGLCRDRKWDAPHGMSDFGAWITEMRTMSVLGDSVTRWAFSTDLIQINMFVKE